jgi:transcriptional antiterminator RfaH
MDDNPIDEQTPWYVVYTKAQKELFVYSMLTDRQHLTAYLPEVLQKYRGKMQLRPLFPRYLFVQVDLDQHAASTIGHTPGVVRLVAFEGRPLPLRAGVIEAIRQEVERLNAAGGLTEQPFSEGDLVRLRSGPLAGMEAVFVKHLAPHDRAVVLLRFLGQENQVEVDLAELELKPKRRRGTRGRGRKIRYNNGDAPDPSKNAKD